jgi:hypothetical protein
MRAAVRAEGLGDAFQQTGLRRRFGELAAERLARIGSAWSTRSFFSPRCGTDLDLVAGLVRKRLGQQLLSSMAATAGWRGGGLSS